MNFVNLNKDRALEVLEIIVGERAVPITKPFWWDSNDSFHVVACEADWYLVMYQCQRFKKQEDLLSARGFLREGEGLLPSFGFRSEHIGAPLVLRDFLKKGV